MPGSAVFAQIQIKIIILRIHTGLLHALQQKLHILLTLASANDLTDARNKAVHSGDGFAVFIQLHIECLDLLRIICYENRTFKNLFGQITFMFCLQIAAPFDRIREVFPVLLKQEDRLRVSDMRKF